LLVNNLAVIEEIFGFLNTLLLSLMNGMMMRISLGLLYNFPQAQHDYLQSTQFQPPIGDLPHFLDKQTMSRFK